MERTGIQEEPGITGKVGMKKKPCYPAERPSPGSITLWKNNVCASVKRRFADSGLFWFWTKLSISKAISTLRTAGNLSSNLPMDMTGGLLCTKQATVSILIQVREERIRSWSICRLGGGCEMIKVIFSDCFPLFFIKKEGRLAPEIEGVSGLGRLEKVTGPLWRAGERHFLGDMEGPGQVSDHVFIVTQILPLVLFSPATLKGPDMGMKVTFSHSLLPLCFFPHNLSKSEFSICLIFGFS